MKLSEICTREELIEMVHQELIGIRANATQEEKNRLDFENLKPTAVDSCIYGQMTGNWDSRRANDITPKSLPNFDNMLMGFGGVKQRNFDTAILCNRGKYFTPMELYFYLQNDGKGYKVDEHEGIIKFIKGETDEVTLTIP